MRRGVTVIFTLGILLVLFLMTMMLLVVFRLWARSAEEMAGGREALRMARAGVEDAVWELDRDDRSVDSFLETWRTSFAGADADMDGDGAPDGCWKEVKDRAGVVIGRYAVLVEDESGKISINAAGNGAADWNEGHSVAEVACLPGPLSGGSQGVVRFRYGPDGAPGVAGVDDDNDAVRIGADGIDNDGDRATDEPGEGTDEPDEFSVDRLRGDDRPYFIPEEAKMAPGVGEVRYRDARRWLTSFPYDRNFDKAGRVRLDINAVSLDDLRAFLEGTGYAQSHAAQLAANIVDFRDTDSVPTRVSVGPQKFLGTEETPYFNEVEAIVPLDVKALPSGTVVITEKGGHFIELFNPYDKPLDIGGWKITGVLVLVPGAPAPDVFKRSEAALDDAAAGRKGAPPGKPLDGASALASVTIRPGAKIPAHGFYTIGDTVRLVFVIPPTGTPIPLVLPTRAPAGCQQYEPLLAVSLAGSGPFYDLLRALPLISNLLGDTALRLLDGPGNLIDEAGYPLDLPGVTMQKNDPRMRGPADWFPAPPSPGLMNVVFQPWIGGELSPLTAVLTWPSSFRVRNHPLATLGQLSFVHRMEHWRTMDFWRTGEDRKLLDKLTVVEEPDRPTAGRLNINTASETALLCLPMVDVPLARAVIAARPFGDIGDVLGRPGAGGSPAELLHREMGRRAGDFADNDGDGYTDVEAEAEMVFSRIVNLITVRSPVYKITAVGQKVRDRNGNGRIEDSEVLSERRMKTFYDRERGRVIYRKQF